LSRWWYTKNVEGGQNFGTAIFADHKKESHGVRFLKVWYWYRYNFKSFGYKLFNFKYIL